MSLQAHVIRTLTFEIEVSSQEEGREAQEIISNAWKNTICKELEHWFDSLSTSKEVISIDKLEIDLGSLGFDIEQQLSEKAKEVISEKLQQVINAAYISGNGEVMNDDKRTTVTFRSTGTSCLELLVHFIQTGTFPWWARNEEASIQKLVAGLIAEDPVQLKAELAKLFRTGSYRMRFIYQLPDELIRSSLSLYDSSFASFASDTLIRISQLQHVPALAPRTAASLRRDIWDYFSRCITMSNMGTSEEQKAIHLAELIQELTTEPRALFTLAEKAREMNADEMTGFAKLLDTARLFAGDESLHADEDINDSARGPASNKNNAADEEQDNSELFGSSSAIIEQLKKIFISIDSSNIGYEEKAIRLAQLIAGLGNDTKQLFAMAERASEEYRRQMPGLAHLFQLAKLMMENGSMEAGDDRDTAPNGNDRKKGRSDEKTEGMDKENLQKVKKEPRVKENIIEQMKKLFDNYENDITSAVAEGIYISNAGLIILSPYLAAFFTRLGLMSNNEFASNEAAHRAVHILQFLATGIEVPSEEHELVLNKLLCGIDPSEPLSMDFIISETEKIESEALLKAVVENWTALKRSSVAALRSTFLRKEGMLTKQSSWNLKIERQSVDMLVDKLPWSISIIKLPWCKEALYCEW